MAGLSALNLRSLAVTAALSALTLAASARAQEPAAAAAPAVTEAPAAADVPAAEAGTPATGEWTMPRLNLMDAYRLGAGTASSYTLRLDPQYLPLAYRLPSHARPAVSTGTDCAPVTFPLSLHIVDALREPAYELNASTSLLTYSVALGAAAQEGPTVPGPTPALVAATASAGSGNLLNDAIRSIARSHREGNLHFLEFGRREDGSPEVVLVGGEDEGRGGYIGGFVVPGVTQGQGHVDFEGGFNLSHRQQFVAYTLPLNNGGTLMLLPAQSFHLTTSGPGAAASTAPEIGVALDLPVSPHHGPLRLQFTGGPDVVIRPFASQAVSVMPTVNGTLTWSY